MDIKEQKKFLERLYDLDQQPRVDYSAATTEEEKLALGKVMVENDKVNLAAFLDYITHHNWPLKSQHGEKACDTAWYIIQHSSLELIEKYLPVISALAEKDDAKQKHVGMMTDRFLMWKQQPQIYGSQIRGTTIWPVKNPDMINALRMNMGFLESIEEYASRMEAIYDPTLKIGNSSPIL